MYHPTTKAVWVTKRIMKLALSWAMRHPNGIIWVEHQCVGRALQELGVPFYGQQGLNSLGVPVEKAQGSIAASIGANSEGRNLQRYHDNLILSPPTNGDIWEQLIGRTHRNGQSADTVNVEIFLGCREAYDGFGQALSDATYQSQLLGTPQKLLLADIGFEAYSEPKLRQKTE
jgi:hypothetical protein